MESQQNDTATRQQWIDTMIALAVRCYNDHMDYGAEPDDELLAVLANAMHDVRVRDTLMWYVAHMDDRQSFAFVIDCMTRIGRIVPSSQEAPAFALAAMVFMMVDDFDSCLLAVQAAMTVDPDYAMALLMAQAMTIQVVKQESLSDVPRDIFAAVSLEQCRTIRV